MKYVVRTESGTTYVVDTSDHVVDRWPRGIDPDNVETTQRQKHQQPRQALPVREEHRPGRSLADRMSRLRGGGRSATHIPSPSGFDLPPPPPPPPPPTNMTIDDELASADSDSTITRFRYISMVPPVPLKGQHIEFTGKEGKWVTTNVIGVVRGG